MPEIPKLDPIVHAPLRLALLTTLSTLDQADFTYLRQLTETTDGNLGMHIGKLQQAGYIKTKKRFVQQKPQTTYRITSAGREALLAYVRDLKKLLAANPALSIR